MNMDHNTEELVAEFVIILWSIWVQIKNKLIFKEHSVLHPNHTMEQIKGWKERWKNSFKKPDNQGEKPNNDKENAKKVNVIEHGKSLTNNATSRCLIVDGAWKEEEIEGQKSWKAAYRWVLLQMGTKVTCGGGKIQAMSSLQAKVKALLLSVQ